MDHVLIKTILIDINSAAGANLYAVVDLYKKGHPDYINIPENAIKSMESILASINELNKEAFETQMCYKSNTPCKYGCSGLCKDSC